MSLRYQLAEALERALKLLIDDVCVDLRGGEVLVAWSVQSPLQ